MAKNQVNIEWSGTAAKAIKEADKIQKEQVKIIAQLQKEARASKKAEGAAVKYYRGAAGQADKMHRKQVAGLERETSGLSKKLAAQRQITHSMKESAAGAGKLRSAFTSAGTALVGMLGVQQVFAGVMRSITEQRQRLTGFETEMTPLLALGENVNKIGEVKKQVLDLSNASSLSTANVTQGLFAIQSGASHLSKSIRDDLMSRAIQLTKVTGTDLPTAIQVLLKGFLIYGEELGGVERVQAKLNKTAELGYMTFQDLGVYMPEVMAAGKAAGYGFDDLSASLITATQLGGQNEKTFTAFRNILLRMDDAIQQGYTTRTDLITQLEDLEKVDPSLLKKIFGVEGFGAVMNLVGATEDLHKNMKKIENIEIEYVSDKQMKRLTDVGYLYSEITKQQKTQMTNIPMSQEYIEDFGKTDIEWQLRKLRNKMVLGPAFSWLTKPKTWFQTVFHGIGEGAARMYERIERTRDMGVFLPRIQETEWDDPALRGGKILQQMALSRTPGGRVLWQAQEGFLEARASGVTPGSRTEQMMMAEVVTELRNNTRVMDENTRAIADPSSQNIVVNPTPTPSGAY